MTDAVCVACGGGVIVVVWVVVEVIMTLFVVAVAVHPNAFHVFRFINALTPLQEQAAAAKPTDRRSCART